MNRSAPDGWGFEAYVFSAHYRNIVLVIYKYIDLLRCTPPQERVFQELKTLSDIRFQFLERSKPAAYVSAVARWLQQPRPREKIISSQYVIERFDPDEISLLTGLLDIGQSFIVITSKSMPEAIGPLDQVEPVFGTKYRLERIPEDLMKLVNSSGHVPTTVSLMVFSGSGWGLTTRIAFAQ